MVSSSKKQKASAVPAATPAEPVLSKSQLKNRARKEKKLALAALIASTTEKNNGKAPKPITEREKRESGYLSTANLTQSNPGVDSLITLSPNSPEMQFAKKLGDPDQAVRHATIKKLKQYITKRAAPDGPGFSELDFLKLHKALYMCVWLSDKRRVQQEVCRMISPLMHVCGGGVEEDLEAAEVYMEMSREWEGEEGDHDHDHHGHDHDEEGNCIMEEEGSGEESEEESEEDSAGGDGDASTEEESAEEESGSEEGDAKDDDGELDDLHQPHCRGAHLSLLFLQCALRTLSSEWARLDIYRLDKFYDLIRLTISETFKYMSKRSWHMGIVRQFNDVIVDEVLLKLPNGMRYHFTEVALEELVKVDNTISTDAFICIVEPYMALAQVEDDKQVREKVLEHIFMKFLVQYSVVADEKEDDIMGDDEEEVGVFENVDVQDVAEWIFEVAKDEGTRDSCRKGLYDVNKSFLKRLKKRKIKSEEEESVAVKELAEFGGSDSPPPLDDELRAQAAQEMTDSAKKAKKKKRKEKEKEEKAAEAVEEEEKTPVKKKRRSSVDIQEMADSDDDLKGTPDKARRLSWGVNKSKSYKKSMSDMKSKEVILSPPPKNGCLKSPRYSTPGASAKKEKREKKEKSAKKGRASATDYF